jgi:hypothetical protein
MSEIHSRESARDFLIRQVRISTPRWFSRQCRLCGDYVLGEQMRSLPGRFFLGGRRWFCRFCCITTASVVEREFGLELCMYETRKKRGQETSRALGLECHPADCDPDCTGPSR